MSGKTFDITEIIHEDRLGCAIAEQYAQWQMFRAKKLKDTEEVTKYVYATDTTTTTNSKTPWKNKTTIPKLCQIADNLIANYMAALFPKKNNIIWDAYDQDSETLEKKEQIQNYMRWIMCHPEYEKEVQKLVRDYVHYGNCFAIPDWIDETYVPKEAPVDSYKIGYIGPTLRRISPLDIVFNPIAPTFEESPKIIRSMISLGELKALILRENPGDEGTKEELEVMYKYLMDLRKGANLYASQETQIKDASFSVDGFTNFTSYLQSEYVEVLTFYGDIYEKEKESFHKNHKIVVVDRHKVISNKPNPSWFGRPPIYHCGWRTRPDSLWAMGPLDNLVGMQYRIDHLENLKADCFDLIAFPPLKIKGHVEDFQWGPFSRIHVSEDGDVEVMSPDVQVLNANLEINQLEQKMEEMAGAPKEALGIRTPGEKTMYEVQRLENAAGRIYQAKVTQFEKQIIEPSANGMLELARRRMKPTNVPIFDEDYGTKVFMSLTPEDVTGNGRVKPMAARHFAERAEKIQNLNQLFSSPMGQNPSFLAHLSSVKLAKMVEEMFDLKDYEIFMPYVAIGETIEAQKLMQSGQQAAMVETQTPAGIAQDDYDEGDVPQVGPGPEAMPIPDDGSI